jgi:hypothetical protein
LIGLNDIANYDLAPLDFFEFALPKDLGLQLEVELPVGNVTLVVFIS